MQPFTTIHSVKSVRGQMADKVKLSIYSLTLHQMVPGHENQSCSSDVLLLVFISKSDTNEETLPETHTLKEVI
jgi:hypothetical protein